MKIVAFVPIKMNNERLPGKNIKKFKGGRPLISYILDTLKSVEKIDDIYVFCSDENICNYLPKGVKFLKRDRYLDLSSTSFNEVLASFANTVESDIYILTHATAPFITKQSFNKGIDAVISGKYDSALTVQKMQEFLWKDKKPFNYDVNDIPRTQDLEPLYTETCGMYIYNRNLIIDENRRIGYRPFLIEVSKIEACDINEPIDFTIANAIYQSK
ncbi:MULTISPECIES: acylneuraminate cytidylyltransferase family protein [unclassified Clostridium]|uniref:acylneuraminate cytidylyltransferase family protein n=1 Tax=unclassified Clostridium TaxID=2614128 RepID=UPI00207A37FF|nr:MULTISPECIES: acylneuraminate cytidylyltransferase family protein [unclassified Clostridium]